MSQEAQVQLDYAPDRPRKGRGLRIGVWVAWTLVLIAVLLESRSWLGQKYQRWCDIRAFSRSMRYEAPADKVVLESSPIGSAQLLRDHPSDYVAYQPGAGWGTIAIARDPGPWQSRPYASPPSNRAVVFLHERTMPNGKKTLIEVEYSAVVRGYISPPGFHARVVGTTSLFGPPPISGGIGFLRVPVPLRIYFGQADPIDSSHFTIHTVAQDGVDDVYDCSVGSYTYRGQAWPDVRMSQRPRPPAKESSSPVWP